MNYVSVKDSKIIVDGEKFNIDGKQISLEICFDKVFGFVINSFKNTSENVMREYVAQPKPFYPISEKIEEETVEKGAFDDLVNAMPGDAEKNKNAKTCSSFKFIGAMVEKSLYGGVICPKLTASCEDDSFRVTLNLILFPGCDVVRYFFEIENLSGSEKTISLCPFDMGVSTQKPGDIYRAFWFAGGHHSQEYGMRYERSFGARSPKLELHSHMTSKYVPLIILMREDGIRDGIMAELDYCADWSFCLEKTKMCHNMIFSLDGDVNLCGGEKISVPSVTLCTFSGDMDNLMVALYDWQYTYMWDYTLDDYHAKIRDQVTLYPWVYCSRNLHEQFAYRLVCMDLLGSKLLCAAGIDMSWDDAGWSSYHKWPEDSYATVFENTYEGPDHRLSTLYFDKLGMKRLIWYAGKPTPELLCAKEGAWGEHEWRTDAVENYTFRDDAAFRKKITDYLDGSPRRSFHTCSGGARFSNTFDMQRFGNYHYMADNGVGPCRNYYYSYFATPDRWGDLLPSYGGEHYASDISQDFSVNFPEPMYYNRDNARANLSMCGLTGPNTEKNLELIRADIEIYSHLLKNGVAGRWSYMFHPEVFGDRDIYYMQRTSNDRNRACIIIRRRPEGKVTVFPKGLIEDTPYNVSFEVADDFFTKSGKELMEDGIVLRNTPPGELIYLNMPTSPSKARTAEKPVVLRAVCKNECNVGVSGVGIYWSASSDNIRYYEILKNNKVIGKSAKAKYYFDDSATDDGDTYSVRAVGFGIVGDECAAMRLGNNTSFFSTLGTHGKDMSQKCWTAETSYNLKEFEDMVWIEPEKNPGADFGGTPNQTGGIEGYFEGSLCARVGRGWQQADPKAYCVRKFTAPKDGSITLSCRAVKEWYHSQYGDDVDVCIMKNDDIIVPFTTLGRGDTTGLSVCERLIVEKGDTIRFIVGKCDESLNDTVHFEKNANIVGLNAVIVYDEQKTSLALPSYAEKFDIDSNKGNDSFTYSKPVPDGIYAVRLTMCESRYESAAERFMSVKICGSTLSDKLDIFHDARGKDKPLKKTYRYIVPDENGNISIELSSNKGGITLDSIEIVPEHDEIIRINCGAGDYTDWAGFVWSADKYFIDGEQIRENAENLTQANPTLYDKSLYATGRCGNRVSYSVPCDDGIYSVHLLLAELEGVSRPTDIYICGSKVKSAWSAAIDDVPQTCDLRFEGIRPVDGCINIELVSLTDNPAILHAIEID